MSPQQLSFKIFILLLSLHLMSFGQGKDGLKRLPGLVISEKENITITGNIKDYAPSQGLLDEYAFQYIDFVTGESVTIPITKDTAGNYRVTFQTNGYQEIELSRGYKMGEKINFGGMIVGRFFVRPGIEIKYDNKKSKNQETEHRYAGDLAKSNNMQETYYESLRSDLGVIDLIDYSALDSIKQGEYKGIKQQVLANLRKVLDFNTRFFKNANADPFLKDQFDLQYKYSAAQLMLLALYKSKEKDLGFEILLDSIGAPLNNAKAIGSSSYKRFLNEYYNFLERETFEKDSTITVLFTDMARYLLNEHNEFDDEEKKLLYKVLDTVNKPSSEEIDRFSQYYMGKFDREYLETIKTKMTFEQIASLRNPFLVDIYLTRLLRAKLDKGQLVNFNSLIPKYKKFVRETPIKSEFLSDYQLAYDRLYKSKLSSKSVLNDATKLPQGGVVKSILEKYKGKVVYLDIWATWCVPCLSEMSNSKKLREQLVNTEVVFLYLCISSPTESNWKNLIAGHNIEGEHYFLNNIQSAELAREFNIMYIPRYLIIDKDGNLANATAGSPLSPKTRSQLEKLATNPLTQKL